MKKEVWKFKLTGNKQFLEIPKQSEILSIQQQHNELCMWILVNPVFEKEKRYFEVFCTGEEIYYDMGVKLNYIGTAQIDEGFLILHVFERIE